MGGTQLVCLFWGAWLKYNVYPDINVLETCNKFTLALRQTVSLESSLPYFRRPAGLYNQIIFWSTRYSERRLEMVSLGTSSVQGIGVLTETCTADSTVTPSLWRIQNGASLDNVRSKGPAMNNVSVV